MGEKDDCVTGSRLITLGLPEGVSEDVSLTLGCEHSETGARVCWKLRQSGSDWPMSGGEALVKEPLSHHSLCLEQQPQSQRPTRPRHKKMSQSVEDDCDAGAGGGTWGRVVAVLSYRNTVLFLFQWPYRAPSQRQELNLSVQEPNGVRLVT